jgi:hypothetical protein
VLRKLGLDGVRELPALAAQALLGLGGRQELLNKRFNVVVQLNFY